jgi:hypothetical protein
MSDKKPPSFLKEYFWDVDFKDLNLKSNANFIAERILEQGDEKAIIWLIKNTPRNFLKKTVIRSRFLCPRSVNFWSLILGFNRKENLCLKKSLQRRPNAIWTS